MGLIEEQQIERDHLGRLKPGHKGLKPKGSTNRLTGEIKEKIVQFISGELDSITEIYSQCSPKEKLRFIAELLGYVLPKSKIIEAAPDSEEPAPNFDLLTDEDLRALAAIQQKLNLFPR
jgi:hypothetical protein